MRSVFAVASIILLTLLFHPARAASQGRETPDSQPVPHTPWGHPDLQGTWTSDGVFRVPLERRVEEEPAADPAQTEAERRLNIINFEPETDVVREFTPPSELVVDPPSGRIPLTPEARAALDAWRVARHGVGIDWLDGFDLWDRCITLGGPPITMVPTVNNNGLIILQTPDHVAIFHELIHDVRIIPLGESPPLDPTISQWLGDSRGHWEGDTLVVEVTNYSDKTFGTQQPHGSYLGGGRGQRVVERFRRLDDGVLEYRATVEDPRAFTAPWTIVVPMLKDDNYILYEYACHEGNIGMELMLRSLAPAIPQ